MGYKLVYNTDTKVELKFASGTVFLVYLGDEIPATTTTTTLACNAVVLHYYKFDGPTSCSASQTVYRLNAPSLATASKIYSDAGCTTYAATGYYSDGSIYRYWTYTGTIGAAVECPATTTTTSTTVCGIEHFLGYSSSSCSSACSGYDMQYCYLDDSSISQSTAIYIDYSNCTRFATAGYYADFSENICRYWNGTAFEGNWYYCPSATTTTGGPTTTTTTTHVSCTQISGSLYFSVTSGQDACNNAKPLTLYGDNLSFASTTTLHTNSMCGPTASSGYYSNKSIWRYWNVSSFTSSGACESPD